MGEVGRPKNIATPGDLWQHFTNYRHITKNMPFLVHDYVGKDAIEVHKKRERALSYDGFSDYLYSEGVISAPDHYFMNYEGRYGEFVDVCARIKTAIRRDQIEGGLAGVYNHSITQRLNNLVERVDNTTGGDKLTTPPTAKLPDGRELEI